MSRNSVKERSRTGRVPSIVLTAALALILAAPAGAVDLSPSSGNFRLNLDTTVSWGANIRMEDRDMAIISPFEGGTAWSVNGDDGDLNFDTGLVSNTIKATVDFDFGLNLSDLFLSGRADLRVEYANTASHQIPSVWYTGRLVNDPLGTMPQGEASIIDGTGSQTGGGNRWGDYTSTTVDPVDDCTFWHVNEWLPTTSASGWVLRAGAFKFPECSRAPDFTIAAQPPVLTRYATSAGSRSVITTSYASDGPWLVTVIVYFFCSPANTVTGVDVFVTSRSASHATSVMSRVNAPSSLLGLVTVTVLSRSIAQS